MKYKIPDINHFLEVYQNNTLLKTAEILNVSTSTIKKWRNYFGIDFKKCKYKNLSNLKKQQIDLIEASLLGDGSLSLGKSSKNARFAENHCGKQKEYLKWKFDELMPFSSSFKEGKRTARKRCKVTGKVSNDYTRQYDTVNFKTIVHPELTILHKKWYLNKKKILPQDFELTEYKLSIWYCDDGSNCVRDKNQKFSVDAFDEKEINRLINLIKQKFNFDCFTSKSSGKTSCIYIKTKHYNDFMNIVSKNIPKNIMDYKIMGEKV